MTEQTSGLRIYRTTKALAFPRLGGTPEEKRALDLVAAEMAELGLPLRWERFPVRTYQVLREELEVLEPYRRTIPCAVAGLTGSTPEEGIETDLAFVESAYPEQLTDVRGKAALTYRIPLSAKKYQELSRSGMAALIRSTEPWEPLIRLNLPPLWHLKWPEVPMAHIPFAEAEALVRRRARRVRLNWQTRTWTGTGHNLGADIPGSDGGSDYILVGAHIDSTERSPGASDNAAGCAVLIELARLLTRHPPRHPVRLVWFGAEETGCIGSYEHVRLNRADLDRHCRLYLNVDVTGSYLGREEAMVVGSEGLKGHLEILSRQKGLGVRVYGFDKDNMTDIQPLCTLGIPAVALERVGGYGEALHTEADSMEHVGPDALARTAEVARTILRDLTGGRLLPDLPRVPEEIRMELRKIYVDRDGMDSEDQIFTESLSFLPGREPEVETLETPAGREAAVGRN